MRVDVKNEKFNEDGNLGTKDRRHAVASNITRSIVTAAHVTCDEKHVCRRFLPKITGWLRVAVRHNKLRYAVVYTYINSIRRIRIVLLPHGGVVFLLRKPATVYRSLIYCGVDPPFPVDFPPIARTFSELFNFPHH